MLSSLMVNGEPTNAKGVLAPHAGYVYSGKVAGKVFSSAKIPDRVLLLGPNHTGYGTPFSVFPGGEWQTPLGRVEIDPELTQSLLREVKVAEGDVSAHLREHSLEVEVNFLQKRHPKVKIAAVVASGLDLQQALKTGDEIARAIKTLGKEVLLVASSDMSHYLPDAEARKRDRRAIEAMLVLDEEQLWKRVTEEDISMCGYLPATILIRTVKCLGATRAVFVDYATSGETSGDYDAVVGYAGLLFS